MLKTIENKRSGKVISLGTLPSCSTATVANADTSSDDDMEMELSDYKLSSANNFLWSSNMKSTINEFLVAATTSSTKSAAPPATQKHSSSVTTDEMSLSESDITTNTSMPATNTPSNQSSIPRRTSSAGTQPAIATTSNVGEQDEDTQSMEMSSISID